MSKSIPGGGGHSADLKQLFFDTVVNAIDDDGVYPHICMALERNGQLRCEMLDLGYPQVLRHIAMLRMEGEITELIFGVDRETRKGQGTEFNDVLTCAYWRCDKPPSRLSDGTWEVGVINYQPTPKIVRPFDWKNKFWQNQMTTEIRANDDHFEQAATALNQVISGENPREGRPDDISAEELKKWTTAFSKWIATEEDLPRIDTPEANSYFLEMFIAGEWLGRELAKLTADEQLIEDQQRVAGQRTFMDTIWAATKKVLVNFKSGIREKPGAELASKIMVEQAEHGRRGTSAPKPITYSTGRLPAV